MNEQKTELKLINMEDVVSKEVNWLWYPYIPFGKITIIEGDPGEGKTTLILNIAACQLKCVSFLFPLVFEGCSVDCTD